LCSAASEPRCTQAAPPPKPCFVCCGGCPSLFSSSLQTRASDATSHTPLPPRSEHVGCPAVGCRRACGAGACCCCVPCLQAQGACAHLPWTACGLQCATFRLSGMFMSASQTHHITGNLSGIMEHRRLGTTEPYLIETFRTVCTTISTVLLLGFRTITFL
jgi:hypothetical protein